MPRLHDPPFPLAVRLLGRARRLIAPSSMPWAHRRLILSVIRAACAKLDAEQRAGLLTAADRRYLSALRRFQLGSGRSGAWRGTFIFGLADAKASQDAEYWAGCLVHDGVHAWLQSRGRPFWDEVGPCEAQIDYLTRIGARADHIASIVSFRESRTLQRRRLSERA
jgi:hypothetical protein